MERKVRENFSIKFKKIKGNVYHLNFLLCFKKQKKRFEESRVRNNVCSCKSFGDQSIQFLQARIIRNAS